MKLYPILFSESETILKRPELVSKTVTIDELQQYFTHFHLSRRYLDKTFRFTPRIPQDPFHDLDANVIEDDFTPRISLASDIEDAREAIKDYGETYYYIYATQKTNGIYPVIDNLQNCPKDPPKEYGQNFNIEKWLKQNQPQELSRLKKMKTTYFAPSKLQPNIKQQFKGCVPDAEQTHEEWSLTPIEMLFVGTIGEAGDVVQLSKIGADIMGSFSDDIKHN